MARKRAAILEAARAGFLESGFGGTSMESVAARAGVSIMTLYRHASTKADLFEAVVSEACRPSAGSAEGAAIEAVLCLPLRKVLAYFGDRFQKRLLRDDTLVLLRTVMHEHANFPSLADTAYDGLVTSHIRELSAFLQNRSEAAVWGESRCRKASELFAERLAGGYLVKALLGLPALDETGIEQRSRATADEIIRMLTDV